MILSRYRWLSFNNSLIIIPRTARFLTPLYYLFVEKMKKHIANRHSPTAISEHKVPLSPEERNRRIIRITWWGSVVNGLLVIFKYMAGIMGGSGAMIADATHSLSDFLTDFVMIILLRVSGKPKDQNHDFGHGKYETLATTFIGVLLMVVAIGIFVQGAGKIGAAIQGEILAPPGWLAFVAALLSIVLKEYAYRFTIRASSELHSDALTANAWEHRSDALSSIGTALGIGGAIILGSRWAILDPIAAVVVSMMIVKVAWRLTKTSIDELLERSLPAEVETEITAIATNVKDVSDVHNLCTRKVGNAIAITLHIRMPATLSLHEAHARATLVEQQLRHRFGAQTMVNIHVEPEK